MTLPFHSGPVTGKAAVVTTVFRLILGLFRPLGDAGLGTVDLSPWHTPRSAERELVGNLSRGRFGAGVKAPVKEPVFR